MKWRPLAILAPMYGLFWWHGRQVCALLHGIGVIAARAKEMGMEWSGFFRPLRPPRRMS